MSTPPAQQGWPIVQVTVLIHPEKWFSLNTWATRLNGKGNNIRRDSEGVRAKKREAPSMPWSLDAREASLCKHREPADLCSNQPQRPKENSRERFCLKTPRTHKKEQHEKEDGRGFVFLEQNPYPHPHPGCSWGCHREHRSGGRWCQDRPRHCGGWGGTNQQVLPAGSGTVLPRTGPDPTWGKRCMGWRGGAWEASGQEGAREVVLWMARPGPKWLLKNFSTKYTGSRSESNNFLNH